MARELYDKIYELVDNSDQLSEDVIPIIVSVFKQLERDTIEAAHDVAHNHSCEMVYSHNCSGEIAEAIRTLKNEAKP